MTKKNKEIRNKKDSIVYDCGGIQSGKKEYIKPLSLEEFKKMIKKKQSSK